jgi:hypothetical protein
MCGDDARKLATTTSVSGQSLQMSALQMSGVSLMSTVGIEHGQANYSE